MAADKEGKEFSPDEKVRDEDEATVREGSGKQFRRGAQDPESDPQAQRERGSGKEFSPSVKDPDEKGPGTGKEFARGSQQRNDSSDASDGDT